MKNGFFNKLFITGLVLSIGYLGCKKFDNPPAVFEEPQQINSIQRKVLVISIDGVTGSELKTIAPPILEELKKTGKYNYKVENSVLEKDVASWASMLTGVGYRKHLIGSDDFLAKPATSDQHAAPPVYRNVMDYILQYKSVKTAIVTPWENLRNYLKVVDFAPKVTSDLAVKDSTIKLLNTQSQLGALVVNLRAVEEAGLNGGYLATNNVYKDAILKADEYVGEIITALKARKNYKNEDWLVIVTSNHGGSDAAPKNGFIIASHPLFVPRELKNLSYFGVFFSSTTSMASPADNNNTLFNSGLTGDLTVQMDVKFESKNVNYPIFLSKSTNQSSGYFTGWFWGHYGNRWFITVSGRANGGSSKLQISAPTGLETDWHTLTMTIKTTVDASNVPTSRTLKMFIDGNLETTADILSRKSLDNDEPFRIGHKKGDTDNPTPFYGANLTYFNTALDDATVQENYNIKDIAKHPNYANLIGFWPMGEGAGSVLNSKVDGVTDLSLSGTYAWTDLQFLYPPGTIRPEGNLSIISTPSDIAALMMYWMKIEIKPDYGIEGNPFLKLFEIEFEK